MRTGRTVEEVLKISQQNPYTGTSRQVITVSLAIAEASTEMDASTFALLREKTGINDKVFSKLRVIGKQFLRLNKKEREEVVKGMPSSYSTIHLLCSLSAKEVATAVQRKHITPTTTVKEAREYTTQVRFPHKAAKDGEIGRWGAKQEHLWGIYREAEAPMGGEALQSLEEALRKVCQQHGVVLREVRGSTRTLRDEERSRTAAFWREVLERELSHKWFVELPDAIKKQFNLKNIDELRDAPLRSFTGFLIKADGGRENFWKSHGEAYMAKLQYLMNTEDRAQRYNLKRRIEEVTGDRKELAIWNNLMIKNGGLV